MNLLVSRKLTSLRATRSNPESNHQTLDYFAQRLAQTKVGVCFEIMSKTDACACEVYLKSGMGKRYLRNRLTSFLTVAV